MRWRYAPDGKTLISASKKDITLWNVETGKQQGNLPGHTADINALVMSPDGKILATASDDNTIRLWDPVSMKQLATIKGHTNYVKGLSFSADSKVLASGSWDNTMKLWDVPAILGAKK